MMTHVLAYIDPGSGSILIQVLIGSIFGAGLYFRQKIGRIINIFKRS